MASLYPLKFDTIFKDKIWGGQKIKTVLDKDFGDLPNCGETWEVSGVKGNVSVVSEGILKGKSLPEIIEEFKGELVGDSVYTKFGAEFPLLIKFIDANDDLSVQVHPDDELAKKRHNSFGKTEMWYVFQADKGATLIDGFKAPITKEAYQEAFNKGEVMSVLNKVQVQEGDVYFLPAGRVHTIGKGLCIAEIQQTSDITYRIYDFDRKDAEGNLRELHVAESLDAIDYTFVEDVKSHYVSKKNEPIELVTCEYFSTNKLELTATVKRAYTHDSFTIYICFEGAATIETSTGISTIKKGEVVLIPARLKEVTITPSTHCGLLETFIG